ncbi:hypothetical protein PPSIR1_37289 [Plesiocystis pacifica SIR-1]|uniref:Uncharacterized protein n=1 Tax=Plesiocystis pacifica SIR-1 TaxID=391625 RepID=A6G0M3_9BACT|nr:hypothetical protein [Plesiocystis pacifica]EDM80669.1 hypothetical protein PPSIR1_37289 [Plesiocystis pacifica SIR-1]
MESLHTLSFGFVQDVFLLVHKTPLPNQEEWARMMQVVRERETLAGVLVIARDARPGPDMRKEVQAVTRKFGCKTAVITDSVVAKGVMVAMTWLNIPIGGFRTDELDDAIRYLDYEPHADALRNAIEPFLDRSVSGTL